MLIDCIDLEIDMQSA